MDMLASLDAGAFLCKRRQRVDHPVLQESAFLRALLCLDSSQPGEIRTSVVNTAVEHLLYVMCCR